MSPVCAVPGVFVPTKTTEELDPLDDETDPELVPDADEVDAPPLGWLDELLCGAVPLAEVVDPRATDAEVVDPLVPPPASLPDV